MGKVRSPGWLLPLLDPTEDFFLTINWMLIGSLAGVSLELGAPFPAR